MNSLKISTDHLKNAGKISKFIQTYTVNEIEDFAFSQDLSVKFELDCIEGGYTLSGLISGDLFYKCSRCLKEFKSSVNIKINRVYTADTVEIDVEDEIRQLLLLSIPLNPVCDDKCLGLCSQCGVNFNVSKCKCKRENVDPRLKPLEKLLKKTK